MIRVIKNKLRTSKIFGKTYVKLCEVKINILNRHKKKNLQKNGYKVVALVQKMLESSHVEFFFDMGTLLGIIRENRLLRHDMDIDVGVFLNDEEEKYELEKLLVSRGCTLKCRYFVDNIGLVEESFVCENVKFDINFYSHDIMSDICYLLYTNDQKEYKAHEMDVVKMQSIPIGKIKKVLFGNSLINIPENAEKYLACRYGKNWRIPNKNYIYWKGPTALPINNIGRQQVFEEV